MARYVKKDREFFFSDYDKDEFIEIINERYPIKFSKHKDLIERIHARYPLIDKGKITMIVIRTFESFRELLLLGKILNFNRFIFDMKLHFFTQLRNKITPLLKVKLKTAPALKKNKEEEDHD